MSKVCPPRSSSRSPTRSSTRRPGPSRQRNGHSVSASPRKRASPPTTENHSPRRVSTRLSRSASIIAPQESSAVNMKMKEKDSSGDNDYGEQEKKESDESKDAETGEDEDSEESDDGDSGFVEPITDARLITFKYCDLNQHLVCVLCSGYFRAAHTINECLHTFCKSCLFLYFNRGNTDCPHCQLELGPNPVTKCIFDRTMQELVDKIFPMLEQEDAKLETEFYETNGFSRKAETEKDQQAVSNIHNGRTKLGNTEALGADVEVSFKLQPERSDKTPTTNRLDDLKKPFLRTSGKLKVMHLKKYLHKKLCLSDGSTVEICCKGAPLGPELSVHFILRTRWLDPANDLILEYRKQIHY